MGTALQGPSGLALYRASRRQLLARLLVLPAALSLTSLEERLGHGGVASGKNKKRKGKKRKRHRRSGSASKVSYTPEPEERAFLELLNAYRAEHGARRLQLQHQLGAAAEFHSQDMATHDYVDHQLSNGDGPLRNIERFGYSNFTYWGEILAARFETAEQAISALKTSPSHNAMMLKSKFNHCGIGRAYNADSYHGWYWTVTFGKRG